jgi:hypothetical protein
MEDSAAVNPGWRKSSYSSNGGTACVEVGAWRKSSYSGNGGSACVEVASAGTGGAGIGGAGIGGFVAGVLVRDTTNRAGATLTIPAGAWRALLAGLRA